MRRKGGLQLLLRLILVVAVATAVVTSVAGEEFNSKEVSSELRGERARQEATPKPTPSDSEYGEDDEEDDDDDDDDDDEGEEEEEDEEEDEYEEELREVAESHEAMSRDERGNSTSTRVNHFESSSVVVRDDEKEEGTRSARNFDSKEKSVEEGSDEDVTSNEAIGDELPGESKGYKRNADNKSKRVPTVKKELSSQRELLSNDTSDEESPEIIERLAERRSAPSYSPGRTREMIDNDLMNDYNESKTSRKLVKRLHPMNLLSSLVPDLLLELERRRNLQNIQSNEEWVQAESLMKLLVRLAENPGRWERAHRLLKDVEEDLDLFPTPLDSHKRNYPLDLPHPIITPPPQPSNQKLPPKKPKKKKKKKKKPKTPAPPTTPLPTPLTTHPPPSQFPPPPPSKWRLVAERLFGPNLSKFHFLPPPPPPLPTKTPDYLSDDYTRKFHFGKVNTHEKSSEGQPLEISQNQRSLDYDIRSFPRSPYDRYHQYPERIHQDDLDDYEESYADPYPHRLPYSKTWRWSRYNAAQRTPDTFFEDRKILKYQPWRGYPMVDLQEENVVRQPFPKFNTKFTPAKQDWPIFPETRPKIFRNSSPVTSNIKNEINETTKTKTSKEPTAAKINQKPWMTDEETSKEVVVPKLTMKTWNSLTSDPATWPLKLPGAKPWPKDKNGKSYNPNAELVRKLGLDKQSRMLEKGIDDNEDKSSKDPKNEVNVTNNPQRTDSRIWKDDWKLRSGKMAGKSSWSLPEDKSTWGESWPGKLRDWNVDFGKESSTWTPKWKQFSYHKVNPASNSGFDGNKARNAFIAMSAVTPSRFPGNEWRKNDIDENVMSERSESREDDPASQMIGKGALGHWIKSTNFKREGRNRTDELENELEELRGSNNENITTQGTNSQPASAVTTPPSNGTRAEQVNNNKSNSTTN